jgi:hypothetical protein
VLHRTIAFGLLLLGGGCSGSDTTGDCAVTHEQKTITTTEPAADPGLQFKIDSCRADVDACPTLCALAMTRAGISFNTNNNLAGSGSGGDVPVNPGGGFGSPVTPTVACDVSFENGTVAMVVKYDVYTSSLGCPTQVNNTTAPTPAPGGAI